MTKNVRVWLRIAIWGVVTTILGITAVITGIVLVYIFTALSFIWFQFRLWTRPKSWKENE